MSLTAGTRFGPYEIVAPLGAGGMGEVYRARDTRLRREVALKVLPAHAASNPEQRARLEREARAIAALSHPHICTLHDVGRTGDADYLVMELIEGETLEARLARGPLPLPEILLRGAEIAEALQFAHRAGVLHRDLKPSNIMLAKVGAKLMDFGLARNAAIPGLVPSGDTGSPTESAPITGEGRIVGTIQYMAPEQLEGRNVDMRSDVWSLGVTLYEMVAGRRPFRGASTASLVGAIMREEPAPLPERAPLAPPALDRLVRTCLAKDPDARWQSAGDIARELRWIADGPSPAKASVGSAMHSGRAGGASLRAGLLGAGIATLALGGLLVLTGRAIWYQVVGTTDVVRTQISLPYMGNLGVRREHFRISPDGRSIALTIPDSTDTRHLAIRHLELPEVSSVGAPEADGAFWSPDSRQVAFITSENRLVKMSVKGGVLQTICHVRDFVWGTWGKDGWIVYGCTSGPLMRVREGGGIPEPATQLDTLRHETTHGYPEFLPDGKHFTYVTDPPLEPSSVQVRVGSVDGKQGRNLMAVQHAPQCDGRGWLVYMRDRSLLAQRVDASGRKLIGNPVPMLEVPERQGESSDPIVSVGAGVLAYVSEDSRSIGVEWYSRDGKVMSHVMDAMPHTVAPAIAPDGRHVALRRVQGGETWLTSIDLVTKAEIRLTDPERWSSWPIWDAAGNDILFSSTPSGAPMTGEFQIRSMAPDTPDSSRLLATSVPFVCPDAVSQDGRWLIERHETPRMQNDLILLDRERGWAERPLVATPANESCGAILAGGTKLAFMSDVTGRDELYLDDFPQRHKALRLTSDGCGMSVFNRHRFWAAGDALYYLALDACSLHELRLSHAGGRWRAAEDRALFTLPINYHGMCPAPDGSRFLVLRPDGRRPEPALTVVLNWQHGLNSP